MSIAVFISAVTDMGPDSPVRPAGAAPAGERIGGSPAVTLERS
ncbi:hypothetical protein [Mycobacterium sp. E802]|nr:hypothetical protein [Mycobacterium sp. E802]